LLKREEKLKRRYTKLEKKGSYYQTQRDRQTPLSSFTAPTTHTQPTPRHPSNTGIETEKPTLDFRVLLLLLQPDSNRAWVQQEHQKPILLLLLGPPQKSA